MLNREQELLVTASCLTDLANSAEAPDSFPEDMILSGALSIVERQLEAHRNKETTQ